MSDWICGVDQVTLNRANVGAEVGARRRRCPCCVVLQANRQAGEGDIDLDVELDLFIQVFDDFKMLLALVWLPLL